MSYDLNFEKPVRQRFEERMVQKTESVTTGPEEEMS